MLVILSFNGCGGGGGSDEESAIYSTGDKLTYTADGVSFIMVYVEGGLTFPKGQSDDSTGTVAEAYWIAETEVTYELWKKVYDWATDAARGSNKYTFANLGTPGDGGRGMQHPVTTINWRDAIVWCNALTEWYNAQKGTKYGCVYTNSDIVLRDSTNTNCDSAVASPTAKGFRLLTGNEWELAARYRGSDTTNVVTGTVNGVNFDEMTTKWTKGDSASGANGSDSIATDIVAWYEGNSNNSTHEVKTKTHNTLDLYDMSGNVTEWCLDLYDASSRLYRGGSWNQALAFIPIGRYFDRTTPDDKNILIGFRIAKSQ